MERTLALRLFSPGSSHLPAIHTYPAGFWIRRPGKSNGSFGQVKPAGGEPAGEVRRPARRYQAGLSFADCTVLYRSMVMVMGPTPPGTGVIARHLRATSSNFTSPTSR